MKSLDDLLAHFRDATPSPNDLQRASMRAAIRTAISAPAPAPAPAPARVLSGRTLVAAITLATLAAAALLLLLPRILPRPSSPLPHATPTPSSASTSASASPSPSLPPPPRLAPPASEAPPSLTTPTPTPDAAHPPAPRRPITVTDFSPRFAPTVDDLYDRADAALAANDLPSARAALEQLVTLAPPTSPRLDLARLDLARLCLRMNDLGSARRHAETLASTAHDPALRESGHHLLCRIAAQTSSADARTCAAAFLLAFPTSTRAAEILALEAAHTADPCTARPLLRSYVDRFPDGAYAAEARKRLATTTCAAP